MMMPFKRQALVEFESIDSAKECVTFAAEEPVHIAGQQAFFNYSTSKRITRPGNTDDPSGGNKVLLLSIQNPLYPITVVRVRGRPLWAGHVARSPGTRVPALPARLGATQGAGLAICNPSAVPSTFYFFIYLNFILLVD